MNNIKFAFLLYVFLSSLNDIAICFFKYLLTAVKLKNTFGIKRHSICQIKCCDTSSKKCSLATVDWTLNTRAKYTATNPIPRVWNSYSHLLQLLLLTRWLGEASVKMLPKKNHQRRITCLQIVPRGTDKNSCIKLHRSLFCWWMNPCSL